MGECRVVSRILGVVSTTRGFAYAATEGPERLVLWDNRRVSKSRSAVRKAIDAMILETRPLFVAAESLEESEKRQRGHTFDEELISVCADRGVKILRIRRADIERFLRPANTDKWSIASAVAARFDVLLKRLPGNRKRWESEDDRIGLFLALARAVTAWMRFRSGWNIVPSYR